MARARRRLAGARFLKAMWVSARALDSAFAAASSAAVAAGAISFLAFFAGAANSGLQALDAIASGVFVFFRCTATLRRALLGNDGVTAAYVNWIRWGDVTLTAFALVALLLSGGETVQVSGSSAGALVVVAALSGFALVIWLICLLFSRAEKLYLDVTESAPTVPTAS